MCPMPAPYPREFRDDVVRVARSREDGVTLAQIAKDFGIHEMALHKWIRQSDIDDGNRRPRSHEHHGCGWPSVPSWLTRAHPRQRRPR